MRTGDEIHALPTWHAPVMSDALDAMRLRSFSTSRTARLKLRRVRH